MTGVVSQYSILRGMGEVEPRVARVDLEYPSPTVLVG